MVNLYGQDKVLGELYYALYTFDSLTLHYAATVRHASDLSELWYLLPPTR